MARISAGYRLTAEGKATIDRLAARLGISATSVIELAARQLDAWLSGKPPAGFWESVQRAREVTSPPAAPQVKRPRGRPRKQH